MDLTTVTQAKGKAVHIRGGVGVKHGNSAIFIDVCNIFVFSITSTLVYSSEYYIIFTTTSTTPILEGGGHFCTQK